MTRVYLDRLARRAFDGPPAIAARPEHHAHLHGYLSDLVRPYGFPLREPASGNGAGHSYGEMAAALIAELVPPDQPVDLLVLAFAIPDVRPGRATATYLSHLCPGNPLGFAICDQGGAAAFTGLRLLAGYLGTGGYRRGLLLVVEQAALPYDPGVPVDLPAGHTAVGLLCGQAGPARVGPVRQHAGITPDRLPDLFTGELATVGADPTLILDPPLAALAPDATRSRVASGGRPHTGVWWELAGTLPEARGRLVLAGYDRPLGYLCLSTIDVHPDR